MKIEPIYDFETIDQLVSHLNSVDKEKAREQLLEEFDRLLAYKNILEWNRLVRVCEALAVVGWGSREPLEALAEKWVNGSYYTYVQNQFFEQKQEHGGQWSKWGNTYVLEGDKTDYGISSFASQRNRLPKSPLRWSKSGNFQKSVKPFYDALDGLREKVVRGLRPEVYGSAFSYVGINLWFSNHDDEEETARKEYFHQESDVPQNTTCKYYIRPRLDIGKLSVKNGELRLIVTRHFTKSFGFLSIMEQKDILRNDFLEIIDSLSDKLKKKKVTYNTDLLKQDLQKIMLQW